MSHAPRPLRRVVIFLVSVAALALPAAAAERPRLRVDDYQIQADLQPKTHRLIAHARVKFTALEDISVATFELHNALRPTRITDAEGHPLSAERITQDNAIRIALPSGLSKDASTTLDIDYEGSLSSADDSPVQGLKLAYVGDDTSYLLYAGRWFPVSGYGTNRFTANMKITVPATWMVMLAQIVVADGTGTNIPLVPTGWTSIRHDSVSGSGNKLTSWVYSHLTGSSEPASYSWQISSQYAAGIMGAWRGASAASPVDQSSGSTITGASPVSVAAPSLTPTYNNELQIYFYGSQSAAAPTIAEPPALNQRSNIKSAKEGFALAFGDLAAPSGGTASDTYVATASTNFANGMPVMTAQAVLVISVSSATVTPLALQTWSIA